MLLLRALSKTSQKALKKKSEKKRLPLCFLERVIILHLICSTTLKDVKNVCRRLLLAIVAGYTVASVSRKAAFVSEALNAPCDPFTKSVSLNISHVVRRKKTQTRQL